MQELLRARYGKIELVAVSGDITEEHVDAIVNAANSQLIHGGGVAGAISGAGGKAIDEESRKWVDKHGPVSVGDVAVTSAGELDAKYVIHAVGPRRGEDDNVRARHSDKCAQSDKHSAGNASPLLRQAIRNSLAKASELGCISVSLPAISTGIFGFPKEPGVKIIVEEAKTFAQNSGTIMEIRFCSIDKMTTDLFIRELEK